MATDWVSWAAGGDKSRVPAREPGTGDSGLGAWAWGLPRRGAAPPVSKPPSGPDLTDLNLDTRTLNMLSGSSTLGGSGSVCTGSDEAKRVVSRSRPWLRSGDWGSGLGDRPANRPDPRSEAGEGRS